MSKATDRAARLMPGGVPRWVRIYDNGGETFDRYTAVFTGKAAHGFMRGMSAHPSHPQGFGISDCISPPCDTAGGTKWPPAIGRKCHLGTRITFDACPPDVRACILDDYRDLWSL